MIHRHSLERAGSLGADAADAEFHLGTPLTISCHHQFIRRDALNQTIDCPLTRNCKRSICRPELVRIGKATNDLQMDLWNSLPFGGHIQFGDNLVDDGFDLRKQAWRSTASIGVPQDDGSNITARSQPFAVVASERAPTRWLRVVDPLRHGAYERFHGFGRDSDRLLPINLLEILDAALYDCDQFGRTAEEASVEVGGAVVGLAALNAAVEHQFIVGKSVQEILLQRTCTTRRSQCFQVANCFRRASSGSGTLPAPL